MGNYIIGAILVIVVLLALHSSLKHFKGEGGCCGGGGDPKPKRKKLDSPVIAQKTLHIEGMHCENCAHRVQRALDALDGAAAKVDLKKHTAAVSLGREIGDAELTAAVQAAGYQVTAVESRR